MSDLITQDQPQAVTEIREQTAGPLVVVGKESKNKKFSLPKADISKIVLLLQQYGVSIAINLVILVLVCLLFLYQINRSKSGNKVVGYIGEEKIIENLKKTLDVDKDTNKTAGQKNTKENNLVKQEKEISGTKNESRAGKVDNSKYVIEANRLYEQGDYKRAAAFYEKGLDKSMLFLNEDFVMYRLGDSYLMSERYEEAVKVFQTLNNDYINSPYHFKSRLKVGECYAGMGEFGKARKTLYTVVAQEGKCSSRDDKSVVVDAYFKIADYYMMESQRLRKATDVGTGSSNRSLASK
ncbi:MAG TPA: tetratricopeptide repeat protein [Candidatus Brocadiaceae bacterium]